LKWKSYSGAAFAGDINWTAIGANVIEGDPKNCKATFYDIDDSEIFIGTFVNEGWRSVKDKIIIDKKGRFEIINAEDEQDPNKKK